MTQANECQVDGEGVTLPARYGEGRCVLCNSQLSTYNPFAVCALCRRAVGGDEESWPTRDPVLSADVSAESREEAPPQ